MPDRGPYFHGIKKYRLELGLDGKNFLNEPTVEIAISFRSATLGAAWTTAKDLIEPFRTRLNSPAVLVEENLVRGGFYNDSKDDIFPS